MNAFLSLFTKNDILRNFQKKLRQNIYQQTFGLKICSYYIYYWKQINLISLPKREFSDKDTKNVEHSVSPGSLYWSHKKITVFSRSRFAKKCENGWHFHKYNKLGLLLALPREYIHSKVPVIHFPTGEYYYRKKAHHAEILIKP